MNNHIRLKTAIVATRFCLIACLVALAIGSLPASALDLASVPDASFSPPMSGSDDSFVFGISPDGRYVLFGSSANNLARQTNGLPYFQTRPLTINTFLRDRILGTTTLVSVDPANTTQGNLNSLPAGVSTNGQYVLFESAATNLVPGDSNQLTDIFMRDLASQTTTLVTITTNGAKANGSPSDSTMTPDGRYVAFSSAASNFVADDTNGIADVFIRDLQLSVTRLVSVGGRGTSTSLLVPYGAAASASSSPAITPDGRFVSFMSTATNLVPGVTTLGEIYVRDLTNNTTVCVSTNAHRFINGKIASYNQKISDDGQIVVFQASQVPVLANGFIFRHHVQTGADDLVASNATLTVGYANANILDMTPDGRFIAFVGLTNSSTAVFVWDAQTGTAVVASVATNGMPATNVECDLPVITPDGRFVSFLCTATNLTTNSVVAGPHIYRRDLQAGITELVDVGTNGSAPSRTMMYGESVMSADGRFIAFDCADSDLVPSDNNSAFDVFVRDFGTETTELVSVHQPGLASQTSVRKYGSGGASLSANGRYLAFASAGSGLLNNYTNTSREIIVRDLLTQSNFLVSVDAGGFADANGDSAAPVISADGHYVAFSSYATNLVSQDTNKDSDVFVRDVQASATVLASLNTNGTGNRSTSPSISSDGRYVLYLNGASTILQDEVAATNYVLGTSVTAASMTPDGHYIAFYGLSSQIYVWDTQLQARIYTNSVVTAVFGLNISPNGQWLAYLTSSGFRLSDRISKSNRTFSAYSSGSHAGLRFSLDGNSLVYATRAANSVDDTNLTSDVYIYDVQTGTNFLVSRSFYSGKAPNGVSDSPDISADGRYVVYSSTAEDIVPNDDNGLKDIFLYDRQSGVTTLLSASGQRQNSANFLSNLPVFTGDGQTVLFHTWASDITENDFNHADDLFLVKILGSSGSTNPPPVFTGQILFSPGSGGSSSAQVSPQLTWAAAPGFGYQVQYKTNLTDDAWLPVNGSVVIEGGQGYVKDLAPDPDRRFYRIVAF